MDDTFQCDLPGDLDHNGLSYAHNIMIVKNVSMTNSSTNQRTQSINKKSKKNQVKCGPTGKSILRNI